MIKKIEISDEIKNIVLGLIYQYQNDWKMFGSNGDSLENFNKLKIPEKNVITGKTAKFFFEFPEEDKRISQITSLIGADSCRNTMMYAKNTIMDWHTNSDVVGDRLYIIYTKEPGIFRYKHPKTGEIIDDLDNVGFTGRVFTIKKEEPFWHCVWSPGRRFVIGFNFERGYNA